MTNDTPNGNDHERASNLTRRRVLQAGASGLLAATVGTSALTATAGAVTTARISPSDGFAAVGDWLEDDEPEIYRIQEPTRSAVEEAFQASGPRVVVFETSGTIDLGGEALAITENKCWVAGQTAPSPGITFVKGMVQVDADDCVVQHIRTRHGPGSDGEIQSNDSLNTADDTSNNVIDHVTASWGTDECLSVGYDTTDTTVTNCLVYEGLYDPYGDGSDHNYATLVGDGAENVTLAGNVWAKCRGRVPRLKRETRSVVANNVMYFFNEATNMDGDTAAAIVGNVYIPQDVEDTPIEDGNASLSDNVTDPSSTPLTGGTEALSSRPLWPAGFETLDVSGVEDHNLSNAGARPADRTDNDARIVSEIRDRAGDDYLESPYDYWIPHPDAVGGYPDLPVNTHSLSVPDTGLREWLTEWAAAVEDGSADPDTGGDESDEGDGDSGSDDGSADDSGGDDGSDDGSGDSTDCEPITIEPYLRVDGGDWQNTGEVTVEPGASVEFGPHPHDGTDDWVWDGPGLSATTREVVVEPGATATYTAAYTNDCGAVSEYEFVVTVEATDDDGADSDSGGEGSGTDGSGGDGSGDDETSSDDLIAELDPGTTDVAVGEWIPFAIVDTTDSDHWITDLAWSFGDGTTATGWWNAHTYESVGTYTVALTATNDAGESTTHEVSITVT